LLLKASLKTAVEHTDVKILNCSLNTAHRHIRTYYARMYEPKFLMGAIAGAISSNGKIGYIADYPVWGTIANINAFALGAKMVNSRAQIYLEWTKVKQKNINVKLAIIISTFGVIGSVIGSCISEKISSEMLRKCFAVFVPNKK